jgi:hypothetical protein
MTPSALPRPAFRPRRRAPAGAGRVPRAWPGVAALTATALAASPALAHSPVVGVEVLPVLGGPGFPEPFAWSLLAAVVGGALGALVADMVPGGARFQRSKRGDGGWLLGGLGKLIVGSASAVVLLTLNPPAGSWRMLAGSAVLAGLGGEALLVSVVSARRAHDAERDRETLRAELSRRRAEVLAKVESVGALAIAAHRDRRVRLERLRMAEAGYRGDEAETTGTGEDASFERLVHTAVERAKVELLAG